MQAGVVHLQDGCEQLPGSLQLIISDEQALVAIDDIQDEALVSIRQVRLVARGVAEVQLGLVQRQAKPGQLVVDLEVDALIWLDLDDLHMIIAKQNIKPLVSFHQSHWASVLIQLIDLLLWSQALTQASALTGTTWLKRMIKRRWGSSTSSVSSCLKLQVKADWHDLASLQIVCMVARSHTFWLRPLRICQQPVSLQQKSNACYAMNLVQSNAWLVCLMSQNKQHNQHPG